MKGIIKKIDRINFGLMSPELIREMSVVKIERPDTYDEDGYPIESGLMDSRLGVIDPSLKCRTCGEKGGECQGHFGMIELARPVIHVGFGDDIHKILRSTCSECGRVLLDDDEIEEFTEFMLQLQEAGENIDELVNEVYKICKDKKTKEVCPHCGAEQEDIKIVKPIDIIEVRKQYDEEGNIITDDNGVPRTEDYDLTASEVREKLQRIPDEDAYVLGVNPEVARPEWMVLTVLPVPPVTIRPSITLDTMERSEDDLTHKLVDILRINQRLIENMEAGAPQLIVEDLWKLLQYHVTTYFDNDASGVPPARHRSGRPLKTLAQRLRGKEGRFRSNLSGKRVNFSARTVISPDPNISINEVGVPEMIAKEVTVPTYVNEWNIEELKEAILNGPNIHPGANYVKKHINGKEMKVRVLDDESNDNREVVVENLQYGDIVMRHLKDGDIVLFNRQPSLHRMSMMAHEVRVLPYKTFRINPCVCPPYNADFDGDEMNMHVFQTDEARAEAKSLLRVQEHILSPRFGGPIIGAIHDHISGAYLLTREGFTVPEDEAFQMIRRTHLLDNSYVDKKHLKRKNRDWTGKELFSLLLPDDLNMNYNAEICRKCETCLKEDCQYDAFVVIKDGQLTHGAIDEAAYGSFSGKILDTIFKEYGPSRAKEFLDRSTDLAICGIMKTGITTSTNDEEIPEEAIEVIDAHLDKAEQEVDKLIATYEEGLLRTFSGRSAEETLEMRIVQVLGEARDTAGEIAEGYLTMGKQSPEDSYDYVMAVENHSVVMARTGARASMLNLAQIAACVGQQYVRGGRITRGYQDRPLPHFRKKELGARAKGFVHSSYKQGLDPVEFFFHAMGGREGLVDTAIRTAQSGYMQRRLVNALEDLNVRSDGLVTDNKGQVIQSVFGEEGIDPAKSDFGHVANLDKLIDEMRIKGDAGISTRKTSTRSTKRSTMGISTPKAKKPITVTKKPSKPKVNPLKIKLKNINKIGLYVLSKKLQAPNDVILGIESKSLSKNTIIDRLLSEFSENQIEDSLIYLNQKSTIINQLNDLDDEIFGSLSNELHISIENSKFENIYYVITNFENEVIFELIDEIKSKIECSTKLEKLDESLFNLLCEVLFIPDLLKKEQINYMTLFYSKSEIKEKLDLCKEQYATINKLNELDETLFDILCGTISILELSKKDRIEYLRNNYSKSEIDKLIENAETKLEYIHKLNGLNEIEFNLLSDILSTPFESKDAKIDYMINNYSTDLIDNKLNETKEKYDLYKELDSLDNIKFTSLLNLLTSQEYGSKEENLYLIVSKFSKSEIDKVLSIIEKKTEISEKLYDKDDEFIDLVCADLLNAEVYINLNLKEEKISFLISNCPIVEIERSIEKISKKIECKSQINDLEIIVFNLLFDSLNKKEEYLKLSKEEKINYLVDDFPLALIYEEMVNSIEKFNHYNELNTLDDFIFNLICEDLSVPENEEDKSYYLVSNYSKSEIENSFDIASDKAECALRLKELEEVSFNLLCDSLINDKTELSKDKKVHYLINNIQLTKIYDEIDFSNEKYQLFNELIELDMDLLDILDTLLHINQSSTSESEYKEQVFETKQEKAYYLVSNYSKKEINNNLKEAKSKIECKSKLEKLNDSTFEILSKILSAPKSLKEDQINHILYNNSVEQIYSNIETSKIKSSLKSEINDMEDMPFKLLVESINGSYNDKLEKENIINSIIYDYSVNRIEHEISIANRKYDYYKSIVNFDDELFSFVLFNFPIDESCISKEDKAYDLVLNNEIMDIQSKVNMFKENLVLRIQLKSFNDDLFDLLSQNYPDLVKYSPKEEKINYLLSNFSKSKLEVSIREAKEKRKCIDRLNNFNSTGFELLCNSLSSPELSKEDKINYLITNYSVDMIYNEMTNSLKKLSFIDDLNNLKEHIFDELYSSLTDEKFESKSDKIYYLINKFSISEINEELNKANEKLKCMDKLNGLSDNIFYLTLNSLSVPDLSKDKQIEYIIDNYSLDEIYEKIDISFDKFLFKDDLKNLEDVIFKILINKLSKKLQGATHKTNTFNELNSLKTKEDKINFLINNYSKEDLEKEIKNCKIEYDGVNNLDYSTFTRLSSRLCPLDLSSQKNDKIVYLLKNYSYPELMSRAKKFKKFKEFYEYLENLDDKQFSLLSDELFIKELKSRDKQIDLIVGKYTINTIKYKMIVIDRDIKYISDKLSDDELLKNVCNSLNVASNLSNKDKIDYLILNYSIDEIKAKIKEFDKGILGVLGGILRGRSKRANTQNTKSKDKEKVYKIKFCTQCGSQLHPDDKFCPSCGKKVEK